MFGSAPIPVRTTSPLARTTSKPQCLCCRWRKAIRNDGAYQTREIPQSCESVKHAHHEVVAIRCISSSSFCHIAYQGTPSNVGCKCNKVFINLVYTSDSGQWSFDRPLGIIETHDSPSIDYYLSSVNACIDQSMILQVRQDNKLILHWLQGPDSYVWDLILQHHVDEVLLHHNPSFYLWRQER